MGGKKRPLLRPLPLYQLPKSTELCCKRADYRGTQTRHGSKDKHPESPWVEFARSQVSDAVLRFRVSQETG